MTEGSQEFCLRWNNHQATIISVFDYLLENETLVDCTLAAEGQYLKAHKVVLCACSPYLELLLSQHNDKHPILIFKDIKFSELKSMIEYMYKGEVNIAQDQLNHFLKAAESLQIKGLSESEEESTPTAAPTPRPPPPRAPPVQRTQPRPIPNTVALPDPHPESPKRLNRNEAVSPSRKRRRQVLPIQGRPSLSGDDASNASEGHLDQSNCDVPSAALATSDNSVAKVESNSELMLEPKTEYDDNSVEDITLDDDEEDYSQAGTSMDNSQMNFSGWQQMVGDKSGDDVFAGQDTGAQNSQDLVAVNSYVIGSQKTAVVKLWKCTKCLKSYSTKGCLQRHLKFECGKEPKFACTFCSYKSFRKFNLNSHLRLRHELQQDLPPKLNKNSIKLESFASIKQEMESLDYTTRGEETHSASNIVNHNFLSNSSSNIDSYNLIHSQKFEFLPIKREIDSNFNPSDVFTPINHVSSIRDVQNDQENQFDQCYSVLSSSHGPIDPLQNSPPEISSFHNLKALSFNDSPH